MSTRILSAAELARALELRDLTNPEQGSHAMQMVLSRITAALAERWGCETRTHRAHPVVPVSHNYDRLHYPPDGAARDARYTRYVSEHELLRTHTSAMIPSLLERIAPEAPGDLLLVCPGRVYRRDQIDRLHTGEPHQVDLWRVAARPLGTADLGEMVAVVVNAVLPGAEYRCNSSPHPYTERGVEIEVHGKESWVEIGECGLALQAILAEGGLPVPPYTGLAMGLGLDRLLMLAKGIDDIRLLRSDDPRIASQMLDLAPYRNVSNQPPVRRDLSIAVDADTRPEEVGDRVRQALGARAESLEAVEILAETPYADVPETARQRLGMSPEHKNLLVRVVIRDVARSLPRAEANALRDEVYAALHEGEVHQWAARAR